MKSLQGTLQLQDATDHPAPAVTASPALFPVPPDAARLIDRGLSFYEASLAGHSERYSRGETPHTLHVWWARRPHSAMRALVFASLSKTADQANLDLLSELGLSPVPNRETLARAVKSLQKDYGRFPRVLDMFGGGGTIPFEAAVLGCDSYSIDVNELAVFLQKANLTFGASLNKKSLKQLVRAHGEAVLERLAQRTEALYPLRKQLATAPARPIVYLWTYSMACEGCGYDFFLSRRFWLSRKAGKSLALVPAMMETHDEMTITAVSDAKQAKSRWAKRGTVKCPKCGQEHDAVRIKKSQDRCIAVVTTQGKGKQFAVRQDALPPAPVLNDLEAALLRRMQLRLPETRLPAWSGIVNPALYGMETHADIFNQRQRLITLMLVEELLAEHETVRGLHGEETARFVTGALSGLVDQMVDWNCRLSMWIPQNEQVGRAFCGPGIAMLWDYAEVDPTGTGPANLHGKLTRICAGIEALNLLEKPVNVQTASAVHLPFPDAVFDAIVTDPPYYDNIFYSVLADFFHAWKKPLMDRVGASDHAGKPLYTANGGNDELVASSFRAGSPEAAHKDYCLKLAKAMNEASRVLSPDGLMAFVYSHASLLGWAALVEAFRQSPFRINSVQPLSIERRARPRAHTSEAVNTCIAFVARKCSTAKPAVMQKTVLAEFAQVLESGFHESLLRAGWHAHDVGVALVAHGVGILSNYAGIEDATIEQLLSDLASRVKQKVPEFTIKIRSSL